MQSEYGLAVCASLIALGGCAPIEALPPRVVGEHVVTTEQVVSGASSDVTATIESFGDEELVIEARRACEAHERKTIDRELETRYDNQARWLDVVLAGSGLALATAGVITLIDSANVAPAHGTGPEYNPVGDGTAIAIGTGLLVGGAVLGTIVAIDTLRSRRVTRRTETVRVDGPPFSTKVACRDQPVVDGALVELRLGRIAYGAGLTDAHGRVATTLSAVIDRSAHVPLRHASAKVIVAGREQGEIDLRRFAVNREYEAWSQVNLQQCVEGLTLDACARVQEHLREYPDGPHADDARRTLAQAEPRLLKLKEQLAWQRLQGSLGACTRDAAEPTAIDVACGVVAKYVRDFPRGEHVREAEAAIANGRSRAAAARESAGRNERQQCVGVCRNHCASAAISLFDDCFRGCVESRCAK